MFKGEVVTDVSGNVIQEIGHVSRVSAYRHEACRVDPKKTLGIKQSKEQYCVCRAGNEFELQ